MCTSAEPVFSRRYYPCFDEPSFKAIFALTIKVKHPSHLAISNTHVAKITLDSDGSRWFNFEDTPLMSTYLFCMIVGKFEVKSLKSSKGVEINVCVPAGRLKEGEYALELGKRSLEFFEEYFGIEYPLKKLDLVSVHDMHV